MRIKCTSERECGKPPAAQPMRCKSSSLFALQMGVGWRVDASLGVWLSLKGKVLFDDTLIDKETVIARQKPSPVIHGLVLSSPQIRKRAEGSLRCLVNTYYLCADCRLSLVLEKSSKTLSAISMASSMLMYL